MSVLLSVDEDGWTWSRNGVEVRATDPQWERGSIRTLLHVHTDGDLLDRDRVLLTSQRERERWTARLADKGLELNTSVLLALEESIRDEGDPGPRDNEDAGQGQTLALEDPEPWPEPVDGAALLDDLRGAFARYLALPAGATETFALWALHAHAHDTAAVSPILALTSPQKRCGKTTALHILGALVPRPLPASNITPAALFRSVEKFRPTLLVDEADSFLRDREELRGVLNSGHAKASAMVVRAVATGDDHEARAFSTWAPKAVALIDSGGTLPDTLRDRSVEVRMHRRAPGEEVERLRLDRLDTLHPICRRAARWTNDHADALRSAEPDVPAKLHDRARDNWRPLLALADLAGGGWPERARNAALAMTGEGHDDSAAGVLLLEDLRDLFKKEGTNRLPSRGIVRALQKLEHRPWPEWRRGNPITTRQLASLLKPFGVEPKPLWMDGGTARGYDREDLEEPFTRYLGGSPPETGGSTRKVRKDPRDYATNPGSETRKDSECLTGSEPPESPTAATGLTGLTGNDPPPEDTHPPDGETEEPPPEFWERRPGETDAEHYERIERGAIHAEAGIFDSEEGAS